MRNSTTPKEALIDQQRILHEEELQGHLAIEKYAERVKTPELEAILEYSNPEHPAEKADKPTKSMIYIKNMVSVRCKMVVKDILDELGLHFHNLELGEVEIVDNLSQQKRELLKAALHQCGLELIEDNKNILVEKIKNVIVEMIHYDEELPKKMKFSEYLSERLNHGYTYLSNLFSEVKGTTIEHYIISHKIERVKEFLVYNELTLSEIAWKLNYSSVAHLSSQFKKITGLTPTHFKKVKRTRRTFLENL